MRENMWYQFASVNITLFNSYIFLPVSCPCFYFQLSQAPLCVGSTLSQSFLLVTHTQSQNKLCMVLLINILYKNLLKHVHRFSRTILSWLRESSAPDIISCHQDNINLVSWYLLIKFEILMSTFSLGSPIKNKPFKVLLREMLWYGQRKVLYVKVVLEECVLSSSLLYVF